MLNSSAIGESSKDSARRSTFSQTCALLSRYVKEKKAFGDISFEMAANVDGRDSNKEFRQTTMNLFPVDQSGAEEVKTPSNDNSLSPFPQHASSTAPKPISSEIVSAPMTIFYAGQVIVINDFPAHKAKEIMELASLGISQNPNTITPDDYNKDNHINHLISKKVLDLTPLIPPRLNVIPSSLRNNNLMQESAQKLMPTIISDLPQKRKASLHRFMGKRKERVAANAPYTTSKSGDVPSKPKTNESNPWLELAAAGAGLP